MKFSTATVAIIAAAALISSVVAAPLPPAGKANGKILDWRNWPFISSLDPASHQWDAVMSSELAAPKVSKLEKRVWDASCVFFPSLPQCQEKNDKRANDTPSPGDGAKDIVKRQVGQAPPAPPSTDNYNPLPFHHKKDVVAEVAGKENGKRQVGSTPDPPEEPVADYTMEPLSNRYPVNGVFGWWDRK
ncbi:hypothetical protein E2P81_ATG07868 [Venturia nashicola]|uniref:Uncharacterized protein n=1 Tax=Venturia nashicola TaxID=86259 RepID=A0A4Z1NJ34_9PEZI|nr:hypothetical protein E6O75_ATG08039 [Venturia nashicola]TLD22675.1 hypothetical protein E2P81_ATG07868 [Venturia nashicola]